MSFEKKVPVWNASGTEPPDSLKNTGFQAGYKPPADYFNWFWHGTGECLKEMQSVLNLKTFTSLDQIGLTMGSETIENIATNLPNNATLFANVGTDNADIYPFAYGVLYVMKRDGTRTFFEFLEKTSARRYYGVYDSTMSTKWSGWEKFSTKSELDNHLNNKENPHGVTKAQVGLGNVPNVATNDQTPTYSDTTNLSNLVSGEKLNVALQKIKCAVGNLISHIGSHKLQTYTSFADIGLTIGSETIDDIVANLPDNSQLFVIVGADGAPIYPVAYGTMHVWKKNPSRTYFEFLEKTSARRYYGVYDSTMATPWSGWGNIYSSANKPNASDIVGLVTSSPLDAYPVGALYWSANSTSPASLFGGTWTRITDRFVLAAGSTYGNGATGGSAGSNHVHYLQTRLDSFSHEKGWGLAITKGGDAMALSNSLLATTDAWVATMPPYVVKYCWQRTA